MLTAVVEYTSLLHQETSYLKHLAGRASTHRLKPCDATGSIGSSRKKRGLAGAAMWQGAAHTLTFQCLSTSRLGDLRSRCRMGGRWECSCSSPYHSHRLSFSSRTVDFQNEVNRRSTMR